MKATVSLAAALAMAVFMSAGIANAADFIWTNAATTMQDWNVAGNWSPNGVPNSDSDTAILSDIDFTYTSMRSLRTPANTTVSVVRAEAKTNVWEITDAYTGKMLVLKAASGNAVIDVKNFGGRDPGGYTGNLRISSQGVPLRLLSNTDITVTNDIASKNSYLITQVPLAGSVTINKHGNGQWGIESGISPFSGTINVYNGALVLGNNGGVLTNAAAVLAQAGSQITVGNSYASPPVVYTVPLVLNGGKLVNYTSDERQLKNITLWSTSAVDPTYGRATFNGGISGTGTLTMAGNGAMNVIGCDIKPGFSTGILNFNRTGADFNFSSNTLPVTLYIDVASGGVPGVNYDQVNVTGLQAGKDVDLANVKVVFSGTGGGAEPIWFFSANRMVNGSTLGSVSNAPGLSSTIVYDYPGNRVGAIVLPEPAALLALACGALLLRRRV